jgi:hypothetical protein
MKITREELQRWVDALDAQNQVFELVLIKETGKPHVAGALNVAFLQTDEAIVAPQLEKTIQQFGKRGEWPPLDKRQALHLIHRIFVARGLVLAVLNGTLKPEQVRPMIPDLSNNKAVWKWLLIDCWKAGGQHYLEGLINAFLEEHGESSISK